MLAVFATLAVFVTHPAGVVGRLDGSWHRSVRAYAVGHPTFQSAMLAVTHLGDTLTITLVDLALFGVCLAQRRRRQALFVAVVALAGWAIRILVRDLIARPRPMDPLWPATGFAFPSGHATNTTLAAALVVVVFWPRLRTAGRCALLAASAACAVAVGFSRVVGGVHWPSDVIGGLLLAGGLLCVVAAASWPQPPAASEP
jgi:membrane-associated phospholipid phosphatase